MNETVLEGPDVNKYKRACVFDSEFGRALGSEGDWALDSEGWLDVRQWM